jgi:hypothetical protein
MSLTRIARRISAVCLLLSLALWCLSLPLHCAGRAALVGGFALLDGGLLGLCLALVTRVRQPLLIYLFLGLAALTFWPMWESWPLYQGWLIGDPGRIVAWPGAPELVYSYFDLLRSALFLLGLPAPFARYGQHRPDPLLVTEETVDETRAEPGVARARIASPRRETKAESPQESATETET